MPERCPQCGSSLLRPLSGGSAIGQKLPPTLPPPAVAVAPAPVAHTPPVVAAEKTAPSSGQKKSWLPIVGAAVGVALLAFVLLSGHKDTDRQMAEVAKQYENAVGVVVIAGQQDGQPFSQPIATAWAVGDKVFASNGHVTEPVIKALTNGFSVFIVLNKNPDKKFQVTAALTHPQYNTQPVNLDGKEPAVPVYDVGLLFVDSPVPNKLKIAPTAELQKLDSGYRVAYLGFPMEGLAGDGVDIHNPVANMQSGIITSTTDYWLAKAPFEKSLLLSHNLAAVGGASGSPIFNGAGEVVGILSAGNIIGQVDAQTGKVTRAPSAALINFAQRIDVLGDIYPKYSSAADMRSASPVNAAGKPRASKTGGHILVKWRQNPNVMSVRTFMNSTLAREVKTFQHVGGGRLQLLDIPTGKDMVGTLAAYRANNLIEYAEPDYVMHLADLPNDPAVTNGLQWALHNIGSTTGNSSTAMSRSSSFMPRSAWTLSAHSSGQKVAKARSISSKPAALAAGGVDIGAEEGWQIRNSAEDIIVAVIDTGVDYNHPDLAANMWHNPNPNAASGTDGAYGFNAVANNGDPLDDNGHGSHVAGIIGAVGNNNVGVCGVAWRVKIMACKCLDADGSGEYSTIIAAIEYAIEKGAKVMNLSLGGNEKSQALLEAFDHARKAGVIMVVAAGNDGQNIDIETNKDYPAAFNETEDNVISVGAVDQFGMPADFSNYGAHDVNLFAPGVGIYSTFKNGGYETLDGTSMATPYVTGALALVLANAKPGENYSDAIQRLLNNAQPLPSLTGKCVTGGMLNIARALKASGS